MIMNNLRERMLAITTMNEHCCFVLGNGSRRRALRQRHHFSPETVSEMTGGSLNPKSS